MKRNIYLLLLIFFVSVPSLARSKKNRRRGQKTPSIQQLRSHFSYNQSLLDQMELAAEAHELNIGTPRGRMIGIVGDISQDDFNQSQSPFNGLK